MLRELPDRAIEFVTEHNRITLLIMVLLTGVVLVGITDLNTESQAGGTADEFEDIDRVEKQQYIREHFRPDRSERSNRTLETVYVWEEGGNALSKTSLLAGLRYQQDILARDPVQRSLHEDGIAGIENLVATRLAESENPTIETQIQALENADSDTVEQVVGEIVASDPRASRFLPANHDGTATSTDRRILVALDVRADFADRRSADSIFYETATQYSDAGVFVLTNEAYDDAQDHFFGEMVELVLPVALLFILLILVFAYRDLVDVVVGMTGVLLSVLWMFGLLGWLDVRAGTVSIVPVVLVTGLSIDFGFHVFNRYREQREPDDGIRKPMARGVRLVATALVLVTLTASIGFLSNLSNPLPVIRDLGVSITLGVISAFVLFLTVVPALKISLDGILEWIGFDRHKQALGHGTYLRPVLESSVTLAKRAAPVVLVGAVLVGAVGGFAWTALEEESFQQADGEVAEWKQNLPGPLGWDAGDVLRQDRHVEEVYQPVSAKEAIQSQILVEGEITADRTLEDIHAGLQRIEDRGLLTDDASGQVVRSPVTVMEGVAQRNESFAAVFEQADTDGNRIPDRNLKQVYDAFYAADSEAAASVLEYTDGEYRSTLVTVSLNVDFSDAGTVVPKLDDGASVMEGNEQRTATAAGPLAVNTAVLDQIVGGILLTMVIALLAIVLAMTAAFKYMHGSATLGAVVSVPIGLVVGIVVGGMFVLGIPLTLLTALLMSLVIGLGVDYNIHIGDRFADELHAGKDPIQALNAAVTGTGGALLGSTLTSAGAFATIALVPHPQLKSFANIVVIALVTSLIVSLLVLPSLLLLWSRYVTHEQLLPAADTEPAPQD